MAYLIEKASFSDDDIIKYQALFCKCFDADDRFSTAYLKWLYQDNPNGMPIGFNAVYNDEIVAHYVCIPTNTIINNRVVPTLLSLNTATAPQHQGKGLFVTLANATYDFAQLQGFKLIYGVANSNSTPGFCKKLGFNLVSNLDVRLFISFSKFNVRDRTSYGFYNLWTDQALRWRLNNPNNPAKCHNNGSVTAKAMWPFTVYGFTSSNLSNNEAISLNFLRIGLSLGFNSTPLRNTIAIPIPKFLWPSPLNFICKPLGSFALPKVMTTDSIYFDFLDFDAY
jgi:GNAT superfamily N-acetyltransferase